MKLIIAVIKPFKIEEVTEALNALGISGITITEVRGHGRQKGHTEVYRGAEYHIEYIPKVRLEILVEDADADKIVDGDRRERAHRAPSATASTGWSRSRPSAGSAPASSAAMPSDRSGGDDTYRRRLRTRAEEELRGGERIVAMLPFASVPKLPRQPGAPRGRKGKVRFGIRQSWRRYRPTVVTDRRLLVFDSGRTPNPRWLLGAFPLADVTMGPLGVGRFGATTFVLALPGVGDVPFETGRREVADVDVLRVLGQVARS